MRGRLILISASVAACTLRIMNERSEPSLTTSQAYEAAYRFVWQYYEREASSESLALFVVAMEPVDGDAKTNEPASWQDWQECVAKTISGAPVPRLPSTQAE
jgi:hypothetical protein